MKIAIILGTRPEIIRLYHTVKALPDKSIYWTGQNFEKNLSDDIFNDFKDAYQDNIKFLSTDGEVEFSKQFSKMLVFLTVELNTERPDKVLVLGDTNSSLAGALTAKKLGIPLYHLESGNRCHDPRSPEEINRRMIDSISDVHLCYTEHARQNLLAEGVPHNKIHVVGNPIAEFPELYGRTLAKEHILITCHRAENKPHIAHILSSLEELAKTNKVIACLHPRYINQFISSSIEVIPSVPFFQFLDLQARASVIITDSGTVCEEASILGKPCVVIRSTMERPELFDSGGTVLSFDIINSVNELLKTECFWNTPYSNIKATSKIVKNILLGKGNYI